MRDPSKIKQLVNGVLKGDRRSIARTITLVENNSPEAQEAISSLYQHTGKTYIIGVTGPTGSGKSTLIEKLTRELRIKGKTVGIVCVDPTSPFTGGAFLGDRVRMQELSVDEGVFIRSMATRGNPGGLAKATKDAVRILDASGKDIVIVEAVGAGQSEVDIIKIAHTILVILPPGLGDEIQAIKAGIMEIGDIFVANKADRENADKTVADIEAMLDMTPEKDGWRPPVIKTIAITGEGMTELLNKINQHREYLEAGAFDLRRKQRVEAELFEAIEQRVTESVLRDLKERGKFDELIHKILARKMDPYSAADMVLAWPFGLKKVKKT